jgi:hypothetical protein
MRIAKSALNGFIAAAIVAAAFWIGGFDFDKRGQIAVTCYLLSVLFGFWMFGISMMQSQK